jgi:rubredoxin/uncharacterized membrane protein
MKKWKCNLCGYVHSGDTPPDTCPVCGATKEHFVEVVEEAKVTETKWQCTVCKYIHKGDEPPDPCPVCGADKSKFVKMEEEQVPTQEPPSQKQEPPSQKQTMQSEGVESPMTKIYQLISENIIAHHLHPITVHIPNGVIPASVLFVLLSIVFGSGNVGLAAFYNTVFVALTMPVVLFTGVVEWKERYGGTYTNLFITKLTCGGVVFAMSIILTLWGIFDQSLTQANGEICWLYIIFYFIMLGAAGIAGHLGGKLVFKE